MERKNLRERPSVLLWCSRYFFAETIQANAKMCLSNTLQVSKKGNYIASRRSVLVGFGLSGRLIQEMEVVDCERGLGEQSFLFAIKLMDES